MVVATTTTTTTPAATLPPPPPHEGVVVEGRRQAPHLEAYPIPLQRRAQLGYM